MAIEDIEQAGALSGGGHPAEGAARTMRITTDGGRLETPARMVSHGEQVARSDIPMSRALPTELAIDFRVVHGGAAAALASGGDRGEEAASRLGRRIRMYRDITERALLRMSVIQPSAAALAGMSAPARVRFADAQAELLRDECGGGGGGLVTYPYLGLGAGDYLRFIGERHERGGEGAALFVLDMGMDGATMEKILAYFRDWRGPVLVPIIYRGSGRSLEGRAAIGRYLGSPRMAFLACQVPREMPAGGGSVSGIHAACFQQGFDMAAPAQRSPPPPGRRMPPRMGAANVAAPARLFSPETWQIEPLADALASRGMRIVDEFLLNEHNGFDRRLITAMLGGRAAGGRSGAGRRSPGARRPPPLRQLACVHEAISSSAEFGRMRAVISEREPGAGAPEIALPPLVPG